MRRLLQAPGRSLAPARPGAPLRPRRAPGPSTRRHEGPPRRTLTRRLHILLTRHRRIIAALLACAAVLLIASPTDDQADATPVLVARSALAGGEPLAAGDLGVAHMPSALVPDGALAGPAQAAGKILVADRARGSVLTTADLLTSPQAGPGRALTGVKLADPSLLAMLEVGQKVTVVVAADGQEPQVLARSAVIRAIPAAGSDSALSSAPEPVIVVSTDSSSAARIATHASGQGVGVVME